MCCSELMKGKTLHMSDMYIVKLTSTLKKEALLMKKKLAILLSLTMVLTFALAACGGSGSEDLSDSKYVGTWQADEGTFAG